MKFDITGRPEVAPPPGAPTASVGLSPITGSANTFLRSDSAPALDVTIVPTWTGAHTWAGNTLSHSFAGKLSVGAPNAGNTLTLGAVAGSYGLLINAAGGSNAMIGLVGTAGGYQYDVRSDTGGALTIRNATLATTPFTISAVGGFAFATPSSGATATFATVASSSITAAFTATAGNIASICVAANGLVAGTTSVDLVQDSAGNAYLYNRSNTNLNVGTNNLNRAIFLAAGGLSVAAPTSGDALTTANVAGANALVVNGNAAGTAVVRLNTQVTTGAQTATFTATNKPGSAVTLTPQKWLPINCDGTTYYTPLFI